MKALQLVSFKAFLSQIQKNFRIIYLNSKLFFENLIQGSKAPIISFQPHLVYTVCTKHIPSLTAMENNNLTKQV